MLVAQDKKSVEVYSRNGKKWEWVHLKENTDLIELDFWGLKISLENVYEGISF